MHRFGLPGAGGAWSIVSMRPSAKPIGFLLLLTACGHGGVAPASRLDLIDNGSFEQPSSSNPQHPAWWAEDAISAGYELDATEHRTGAQSLRVEFREATATSGYSGTIAKLDVSALRGRQLIFEAFLKRSSPASKVGIWLKFAGEHGLYVNSYDAPLAPGDAWARHTLTVTVPPDATRLAFGAAIHEHNGVMWVDDASLRIGRP